MAIDDDGLDDGLGEDFERTENEGEDRFEARLGEISHAISELARNQKALEAAQRSSNQHGERAELVARVAAHGQKLATDLASAERGVESAEQALASAHEDSDGPAIARAQRLLSEAVSRKSEAQRVMGEHQAARRRYEAALKAPAKSDERTPPANAEAEDFTNLRDWQNTHREWYGVDDEMTKAAHEIDQKIRRAGVIPVGSQQYFQAIDRQMQKRFPSRMGRQPENASSGNGGATGARQNGGGGSGRISASVLDGWRRMGINIDDPKIMERMVTSRQQAVSKGLLPSQPATGRVRT